MPRQRREPRLPALELSACDAQGRCATDQVQVAAGAAYKPLLTTPSSGVSLGLGLVHDPDNQAPTAQAQLRSLRGATPHILLNGSGSTDPDGDNLYYRWSFVSRPAGSALSSADINDRDDVTASVTPDVAGEYTLRLWVSDGRAQDSVVLPSITITNGVLGDGDPIEW